MQFLKLASCSFPAAAAAAAAALTYQLFIDLQLFGSRCSRNYWVISAMTVFTEASPHSRPQQRLRQTRQFQALILHQLLCRSTQAAEFSDAWCHGEAQADSLAFKLQTYPEVDDHLSYLIGAFSKWLNLGQKTSHRRSHLPILTTAYAVKLFACLSPPPQTRVTSSYSFFAVFCSWLALTSHYQLSM